MDIYMQRMKKSLVWLTLFSMIIALFPVGLISTAEAASATYFIPNDQELLKTANDGANIENSENPRSKVKIVNTPTLSISGAYSKLSKDSLSGEVELLTWDSINSNWQANKQFATNATVTADESNNNRFIASGVTLFPGLNRITLKGKFGNAEGSDVFYVLYDKIPYFTKLTLTGSGLGNEVNLDEDTRVISRNPMVSISGEVYNANKVTVAVNDGKEISTDVFNNLMGSSPVSLTEGLNKLKITFTNGSDSFSVTREVYYFTNDNPFVGVYVGNDSGGYTNILNTVPNIKKGNRTSADYIVQVMLPYNSAKPEDEFFAQNNHKVTVGTTEYTLGTGPNTYEILSSKLFNDEGVIDPKPATTEKETIINDATGPAYRQITLRLHAVPFTSDVLQRPQIEIDYSRVGTDTPAVYKTKAKIAPSFNLSDQATITSINYLPDFDESSLNIANRQPINGAVITKSPYYIEVATDSAVSGTFNLSYLPGGKAIAQTPVAGTIAGLGTNSKVYKVTESASGEKRIQAQYADPNGTLPKEFSVSFSTAAGIIISNLVDGQSYEVDSNQTGSINVMGEYSNSVKWEQKEYFANGIPGDKTLPVADAGFSVDIAINPVSGPLTMGENVIEFKGIYLDYLNNKVPVSKKVRIYISDKNISSITQFSPGKVISNTSQDTPFPTSLTDDTKKMEVVNFLKLPKEFSFNDDKYTTNLDEYTVVIRGGNASKLNLSLGSSKIFELDIPSIAVENPTPLIKDDYKYELVGSQKDFVIRISNSDSSKGAFRFDRGVTGTHVYSLELINAAGARISQRLEINRELTGYRIISPIATTGDQIIVNKNFVRFEIEAEGASKVIIGKEEATRRTEAGMTDRFTYDYVGLKPDKLNSIKIQIVRTGANINDSINVYYTGSVGIDTQYMAEKVSNKYTAFNKALTLNFPKGTIMQSINRSNPQSKERKFYPNNKLLFGIADPRNGVVERVDDEGRYYGNYIDPNNSLLASYFANFTTTAQTFNFTRISDIYWINGGLGELGDLQATNGVAPYSVHGFFTSTELGQREIVPSQRGTLTIAYDKNVVSDAGTQVTVFKYTDKGGRGLWERVPGTVNTSQNTVTIPFDEFGYYAVYKLNRSFSDITNHPWARNILNALYSKGIMDYLRADAFGADDQTTRGEFATLLVKGLSLPINADNSQQAFFDVPFGTKTTTWDYEHLETAARAGIITGKIEGFFSPNMPITRQEAAVMIARAAKLKLDTNDDKLGAKLAKSYLDSGKIEYYARPAVQAVTAAKIMSGSPVTLQGAKKASYNFNPTGNMTRAEAGKIAVELFKKNKSTKDMFPKNFN